MLCLPCSKWWRAISAFSVEAACVLVNVWMCVCIPDSSHSPAVQMDPDGNSGITFPTGSHPPEDTHTKLMLIRIRFPVLRNALVKVRQCVCVYVNMSQEPGEL